MTSLAWSQLQKPARGAILVFAASLFFATMHLMIRLVSKDLHAFEITFFRNFLGLLVFLPSLYLHGLEPLRTNAWGLLSLRAILNAAAMMMFFYALTVSPLAMVTATWFTAPIFAALLSMLFLREKFHKRRWAALALGFAGTLLIVQPGVSPLEFGLLMAMISALFFGCTMTVVRALGRTQSSITITAYMNIMLTVLTLVPAIYVWQWPALHNWPWLVAIGAAGTCAQIAMAQALKETDTSFVVPFTFFQLVWASAYGYMFFGEVPDILVWGGVLIIVASTSYMAYRENRSGRQSRLSESVGAG